MTIVTLTTDYGTHDAYAGVLKGVILGLAPKATLIDITHDVEPFNVRHGAFVLRQVWKWFPAGTIHLAVVDPGVGSGRAMLLAKYAGQFVLAPDNGLVTLLHREFPAEMVRLVEDRRYFLPEVSPTFHGRDIIAPVAAHLVNGLKPHNVGRAAEHIELLPLTHRATLDGSVLRGSVMYVDRFGTMITNIGRDQLVAPRVHQRVPHVTVNGESLGPVRTTFSEVPPGTPLALIGSSGHLEIAVNQGRAVEHFGNADAARIEVA